MATILHVRSSPRGAGSFSARAAEGFIAAYERGHPDTATRTLDVFSSDLPAFDAPSAEAKYAVMGGAAPADDAERAWRDVIAAVEQLKAADVLVISAPMWNFAIPYRLKQWIDLIVQPSLTFSFDPQAGYAGLITGKSAVLLLARGSDYAAGTPAEGMDMQRPYLEAILRFIGFAEIHTIVIGPTMASGPDAADAALARAVEEAEALARRL